MFSLRTRSLSIKRLKERGIKHVVFDLDGTIFPLGQKGNVLIIGDGIFDMIFRMREEGIKVYVVSNTTNQAKIFGIPFFHATLYRGNRRDKKRWKPWRMREAIKSLGIESRECGQTLMIGNNPFNDGLGSILCGIRFCLVLMP